MKKKAALLILFILFGALTAAHVVHARGQSADDCPPGSTDPDCKK